MATKAFALRDSCEIGEDTSTSILAKYFTLNS